jgi:hypothetical protein
LAVETGIAPQHLLDAPEGMLEAMFDYVKVRNDEQKKQSKRRR